MLSALVLLAATTFTLTPTDDVWVYEHASSQSTDPYLRAWGLDGFDIAVPGEPITATSWSVLRFELEKAPQGTLKSAKLVLWAPSDTNFTADDSKNFPLYVRSAPAEFKETTFRIDDAQLVYPGNDSPVYAKSSITPVNGQDFKVEIDLTGPESKFAQEFEKARASSTKLLGLALTSGLPPQNRVLYKFYSRNAQDKSKHPQLILEFN